MDNKMINNELNGLYFSLNKVNMELKKYSLLSEDERNAYSDRLMDIYHEYDEITKRIAQINKSNCDYKIGDQVYYLGGDIKSEDMRYTSPLRSDLPIKLNPNQNYEIEDIDLNDDQIRLKFKGIESCYYPAKYFSISKGKIIDVEFPKEVQKEEPKEEFVIEPVYEDKIKTERKGLVTDIKDYSNESSIALTESVGGLVFLKNVSPKIATAAAYVIDDKLKKHFKDLNTSVLDKFNGMFSKRLNSGNDNSEDLEAIRHIANDVLLLAKQKQQEEELSKQGFTPEEIATKINEDNKGMIK